MKCLQKDHPALKGIAVILAMMILLVQFTEAFHQHQHPGGDTTHHQTLAKAQLQLRVDCAICHYFAHHSAPVQAEPVHYYFVNIPVRSLKLTDGVFPVYSGLYTILPNKGPPALAPFAICRTV